LPLSSGSRGTPLRAQRERGNGLTVCRCIHCVKAGDARGTVADPRDNDAIPQRFWKMLWREAL